MATPDIKIGSKFDPKGFKEASAALNKLTGTVNKFAAVFGVTFSAQAIARFGASAVHAFAMEERQIQSLTNTVKNLGLAFAAPEVNQYIADLERITGITRDQLQPAFQKLLTQTGSITESQKIMQAALEASASGVVTLDEAATALTNAYVGNKKGLQAFKLGLTNAELASMSFDQILNKVVQTYNGQFKESLDSTATKIGKVEIAAKNAKTAIGQGLVDAFANLAGDGNIDKANSKLEKLGQTLGDVLRSVTSQGWKSFLDFLNPASTGGFTDPNKNPFGANLGSPASWRANNAKIVAAEKKAQQEALKKEQERLRLLQKQTQEKKAQAAVDKANALIAKAKEKFDLEGIQLNAALANETLTIEERKRLELKQATWNLEQALLQNDQARIEAATALLEKLLGQYNLLDAQRKAIQDMYDLFQKLGVNRSLIDLLNLEDAFNLMNQMAALGQLNLPANFPKPTMPIVSATEAKAALEAATTPEAMAWYDAELQATANRRSFVGSPALPTGTLPATPVTVTVVDNTSGLIKVVTDATQEASANGINTRLIRNTGGLNW